MKKSLTPRQEKFCQEIVAGKTQSEAYWEAYKAKNAKRNSIHVNASKLMAKTKIQLRVEELRKPIVQHIQADRVRWPQEIQRCAFFDIRQFMREAGDLKLIQDVDQEHLAAIAGLEVIPEFNGTGESRIQIGFRKKFRLTDRLDALELFGKAMGFLNVKEQPGSPHEAFGAGVLLSMREELRRRIAARAQQSGRNQ